MRMVISAESLCVLSDLSTVKVVSVFGAETTSSFVSPEALRSYVINNFYEHHYSVLSILRIINVSGFNSAQYTREPR